MFHMRFFLFFLFVQLSQAPSFLRPHTPPPEGWDMFFDEETHVPFYVNRVCLAVAVAGGVAVGL